MTKIEIILEKCSNSKSPFQLQIVWVRAYVNLINLQWDDCYSGNCDEMSKYECFVQRGLNMSHIFHWVVFILIRSWFIVATSMILDRFSLRWLNRDNFREMFKFEISV